MAVVEFAECWDQRQAAFDVQPPNGRARARFVRTYTRVFRARTNNPDDGPLTIVLYPAVPALLSQYFDPAGPTYDAGALLVKLTPTQDQDDPYEWLLRADYTSDLSRVAEEARDAGAGHTPGNPQDSQSQLNPLLRPPKMRWGTSRYQRAWQVDLAGNLLVNTAGETFDPAITTDDDRPVYTITKNMAAFDESVAYAYRNAVNSDTFAGAPPGTLKIVGTITAESGYEGGLFYWEVTGSFEYKADLWLPYQVLSQGYHYISGTDSLGNPAKHKCHDSDGQPTSSQQPLNSQGAQLNPVRTGGSTVRGSTAVTGLGDTTGLLNCAVSGQGIAPGTTVVGLASGSVTLSQPATATGSGVTLYFAYFIPFTLFPQLPFSALGFF